MREVSFPIDVIRSDAVLISSATSSSGLKHIEDGRVLAFLQACPRRSCYSLEDC